MKKIFRPLPTDLSYAAFALLTALAIVPRIIMLDTRPLMHDESLFGFYAYDYFKTGHYTHMPILHGPVLMLSVGKLFKIFGDTITVGRGFIACTSFVMLLATFALWPRRYRWWLAPLLITSPVLFFYSRFLRDDIMFSAVATLGILAVSKGLTARRPARYLWAVAGPLLLLSLMAIMENSLFLYASGVTFGLVWLAMHYLWRGPALALRPLRRSAASAAGKPKKRPSLRAGAQRNAAAAPAQQAEVIQNPADRWLSRWRAIRPDFIIGALLGLALILYIYGITSPVGHFAPIQNLKDTWLYWKGQHEIQRISGEIHFHLLTLLTYELPLLLFLYIGLAWDAARRGWRAALYGGAMLAWLLIWALWRAIAYPAPAFGALKAFQDFLHIEPNVSMLILMALIVPLLVWSVLMLKEHRPLAAWMGWWAACSYFQYSSAGEKVPWLAIHIALPLYLTLGWVWAPRLRRFTWRGHAVAAALILATTLFALRSDIHLLGDRAADPRERILYNHTTPDFDRISKRLLATWEAYKTEVPLDQRRVALVDIAGGGPSWPGCWYFRHCAYQLIDGLQTAIAPQTDLLIGTREAIVPLLPKVDPSQWKIHEFSLRDAWIPVWPEKDPLPAWWRYFWNRETWTPPGGYPVIALEPLKIRR